jgi:predicted acylesterase/phospholipase RssA
MQRILIRLLLLCAFVALSACASTPVFRSVPEQLVGTAIVDGFPAGIRSWSDEPGADLAAAIERRIDQYKLSHEAYYEEHKSYPPMSYLALSGGSNNGAFAAGVLYGWTESGTRPEFTIVTGVSTGALIAPFAFLGPRYDEALRREYTTVNSENIFESDFWTVVRGVTGGMALVDNGPLRRRIDEIITPQLFADIAAEHRKGRRLLIITTNLEAQRGVVWSIGSIANSGLPGGLELFKRILLASAAVPGLFEPVLIDVNVVGEQYQEIHVDGGVTSQVFLFPLKTTHDDRDAFEKSGIERNLYIIRNGKITPDHLEMKPAALPLSQRSLETLIKYQGIGDLYRIYSGAERDGMNYHLTYIPPEFNEKSNELFDPVYMSKLFDLGYRLNRDGKYWVTAPPGIEYVD